ncbi:hypothetical protein RCG17_07400 [Neobacillus sp. PS3-12]|nr:hypothetical protein [Neobacillus sp. PS3-12]WML54431.1 hypothetical protein RCG17_07400 [Neobacillus sp. PS3-12]
MSFSPFALRSAFTFFDLLTNASDGLNNDVIVSIMLGLVCFLNSFIIMICVGIPALVNTGITFHLLSIFGQNHLSPQLAATVLSLMFYWFVK